MSIFNPKKKYVWNKAWLKNSSFKNIGMNRKGLIQPPAVKWLFKVNKNVWVKIIKSKMYYSESEPDSNFVTDSASNFDSSSESNSESESDFSSAFMNLDICIFFILYLHSSK